MVPGPNSRRRHPNKTGAPNGRNESTTRKRLSAEAARIMAQEGVQDFLQAKRKALRRLNLPEKTTLPTNQEVELALRDYLQLFHRENTDQLLQHMRQLALEAMRFLQHFSPRLCGPVLQGAFTTSSDIQLHLTADNSEEIALHLLHHNIPYQESEKRLRFGPERYEILPSYRFQADDVDIELCVFSRTLARATPLSPVDGKAMARADIKAVEALLQLGNTTPSTSP